MADEYTVSSTRASDADLLQGADAAWYGTAAIDWAKRVAAADPAACRLMTERGGAQLHRDLEEGPGEALPEEADHGIGARPAPTNTVGSAGAADMVRGRF